ncbi:MAG: PDZ domain-containing protein [Candidatus Anammoximicrobium sp.]|nr:PDZ domain-containing protein [Candidatus Anammoximicrobium sp.]
MLQDLCHIPHEVLGLPVFGAGWMLILWAIVSAVLLGFLWRRQGWNADTRSYLPVLTVIGLLIWLVLPRLEVTPDAGPSQGLPIRGYGVMLLLGVLAGVVLAVREARRVGVDPDLVISLCFHLFVAGIIGARLFYVIEYWPQFQRSTPAATLSAILNVTQGGLVVYGSLVGAVVGGLWFLRRHALPVLALADLMAPSLLLGVALGRIGCFLNGCCYGGLCDVPHLGVTFPPSSEPYKHQRSVGQLHGFQISRSPETGAARVSVVEPSGPAAEAGLQAGAALRAINGQQVASFAEARELLRVAPPRLRLTTDRGLVTIEMAAFPPRSRPAHPTQLYASVGASILCWLLWCYYPFRRRDGEVFALFLTLYPVMRYLEEVIRVDEPGQFHTSLSISQWISLALLAAVAGLWAYILRQPRGSVLALASETRHSGS